MNPQLRYGNELIKNGKKRPPNHAIAAWVGVLNLNLNYEKLHNEDSYFLGNKQIYPS